MHLSSGKTDGWLNDEGFDKLTWILTLLELTEENINSNLCIRVLYI